MDFRIGIDVTTTETACLSSVWETDEAVEAYLSSLEESKLSSYVDTIKEGMNRGVNVPYSTYYNLVDQRLNQRMSAWINGDIDGRQFVDEMDGYMKDGMAGLL